MKRSIGDKFSNFSEAVYGFYNTWRLLLAALAACSYLFFSIPVSYYQGKSAKLWGVIGYYLLVAVQNISITLFSIFILDFFVNHAYQAQLKEDVSNILANRNLTKKFIKEKKNREILRCSMEAILGERVSRKIEQSILYHYKIQEKNYLWEHVYLHIDLRDDHVRPGFFSAEFTMNLEINGLEGEQDFVLYDVYDKNEYDELEERSVGLSRILMIPFLMAEDMEQDADAFKIQYFRVNDMDVAAEPGTSNGSGSRIHNHIYKLKVNSDKATKISFQFNTFLNKEENYFFEDIWCVCDGYHLDLNYAGTNIEKCKSYSSYQEKEVTLRELGKQISVDIDDVVLPGNLFIFIWQEAKRTAKGKKNGTK